ncbi:MAG TPA: hypothetical protein VLC93_19625 [Myxococcota bacterium]|nr:hypothetical protein [Myxococcota bacterium]
MTDSVGVAAGGEGIIRGEVKFPGTIGVDRRITLTLIAQSYATSRSSEVTSGNDVRFVISGLPDGNYAVGAALDVDGDGELDEEDWAGFSGGTKSAPILRRGNARQVSVVGGEGEIDVEIGLVGSCLLPLGSTCASDSDCRYVSCDCPAHPATGTPAKEVFYLPTCPNATRVCTLAGTQDCEAACAPAPGPDLATGPCLRDLDLTTAEAD